MKLIRCNECMDVVALRYTPRTCECGASGGSYVDEYNAEVHGPCTVIGFNNESFHCAVTIHNVLVEKLPDRRGDDFKAFVIGNCSTVVRK